MRRLFRTKKQKELDAQFLSYFKIEGKDKDLEYTMESGPGGTTMTADITNQDLVNWLYACTRAIQKSLGKHPEVKNYLAGKFHIGGQDIEFVFMKKGKKTPAELKAELEIENAELKKEIMTLRRQLNENRS